MISLVKVLISIYLIDSAYGYRQNVLDFCSTVLNGDRADGGCTCIGKTGKSGSLGPRGMKGNKGERGDEFDPSELMNQLDVLKSKVERMEKIPEVTLHYCLMGMKSGAIPDSSITSSTQYNSAHAAKFARLDMDSEIGAWCPSTTSVGQWIQVDLGSPYLINATITQGRASSLVCWVKTYKVACGVTDDNLPIISEGGKDKIFQGNSDKTRKVIGWFPVPMTCRYVRLYPQTWEGFMCLRMDIVKANCP